MRRMTLLDERRSEQPSELAAASPRPFTRARLDAEIAAIHADHAGSEDIRPLVMEHFRHALDDGRAAARSELEAGGRGCACSQALSNLPDNLIAAIPDYFVVY